MHGDDGSLTDRIRSHFIQCAKCREGGKVCPCRDRRQFLQKTASAGAVVAALGTRDLIETAQAASGDGSGAEDGDGDGDGSGDDAAAFHGASTDDVFPQSVASGGPTEDGVILWTRISDAARGVERESRAGDGDALDGAGIHPVTVEVAGDVQFTEIVHSETVHPDDERHQIADNDGCFRYDLAGRLDSNAEYFYRFEYGGVNSRTGRCRTLPADDDAVEELQFVVSNCTHYENGYFSALGYAAEHAADFMLHLGDVVYEAGQRFASRYVYERDRGTRDPPRETAFDHAATTLEEYRTLYRTYKRQRPLQRALEQHTVIYTWDDHEVFDDRHYPVGGLPGSTSGNVGDTSVDRYANAIQAWYEHVPARVDVDHDVLAEAAGGESEYGRDTGESPVDLHDAFTLYRDLSFGSLADLLVTDERFYRERPPAGGPGLTDTITDLAAEDPDYLAGETDDDPHHQWRTMLGDQQREEWFTPALASSSATWTLWMNEVLLSPLTINLPGADPNPRPDDDTAPGSVELYHDAWDGYLEERAALLDVAHENGVDNFVALTGDMHASLAATLYSEYTADGDAVGTELMVPAVTAETPYEGVLREGPESWVHRVPALTEGHSPTADRIAWWLEYHNDHVNDVDLRSQGYGVVTLTQDELDYRVYHVHRLREDPPREPRLHRVVPEGDPEPRARSVTAAATVDRQWIRPGETVTLDAGDSAGREGPVRDATDNDYRREWTYEWNLPGGSETGETVDWTAGSPGVYEIRVVATQRTFVEGSWGDRQTHAETDTATVRVYVTEPNAAPEAAIDYENVEPGADGDTLRAGDRVRFTAIESTDPDAHALYTEIDRVEWTFGPDDETVSGPPASPGTTDGGVTTVRHTFEQPGTHEVRLTLVDDHGATDTATRTVEVVPETERPPAAALRVEPHEGGWPVHVGQRVEFDAAGSTDPDGPLVEEVRRATWRFGDGTERSVTVEDASDLRTTHSYGASGDHTASVALEDHEGNTGSVERTVEVAGASGQQETTGRLASGERWTTTHEVTAGVDVVEVRLRGPSDADFDLFVSVDGATAPAPAEYDRSSRSASADERLRVETAGIDTLGVMVYAYSGAGQFEVTVDESPDAEAEGTGDQDSSQSTGGGGTERGSSGGDTNTDTDGGTDTDDDNFVEDTIDEITGGDDSGGDDGGSSGEDVSVGGGPDPGDVSVDGGDDGGLFDGVFGDDDESDGAGDTDSDTGVSVGGGPDPGDVNVDIGDDDDDSGGVIGGIVSTVDDVIGGLL